MFVVTNKHLCSSFSLTERKGQEFQKTHNPLSGVSASVSATGEFGSVVKAM